MWRILNALLHKSSWKISFFNVLYEFIYLKALEGLKVAKPEATLNLTVFILIKRLVFYFLLQSSNGFLYSGLMLLAMVIFALMAKRYKYVEIEKPEPAAAEEMTDYSKNSWGVKVKVSVTAFTLYYM